MMKKLFLVFFYFLSSILFLQSIFYSILLTSITTDNIEINLSRFPYYDKFCHLLTKEFVISTFILLLLYIPFLITYGKFMYKSKNKGLKRMTEIIGEENIVYYKQCLEIFEILYFLLSVAGILLAIWYTKTGALISVISTVEH